MELNNALLESLRNQFFGNTMETDDACARWSKALLCLNGSESVNHLWADKQFREAIYDAGEIKDLFYNNIRVEGEKPLREFELNKILEHIADHVDYNNSASCWQKMVDGILTILPDTELQKEYELDSEEEFAHVVSDFKALAALTKSISQVNEIKDALENAIKNISVGESANPARQKRKHLQAA